MLHFVFDLDYTLYQTQSEGYFDYSQLKENKYLDFLLGNIPFNKIIFTNGTYSHALACLEIMKLKHHFPDHKIVARDTINDLKPNMESFDKFKKHQDIKNNDKVIFFEDSVENLLASKKIDWITIYIGKHNVSQFKSINKQFENIETSLEFIIDKNNIVTRRLQYQMDHS
jgi:putative hydrolase of the HAD superfamily